MKSDSVIALFLIIIIGVLVFAGFLVPPEGVSKEIFLEYMVVAILGWLVAFALFLDNHNEE